MGSRRIRTELAKKGHNVNRKCIVRIMRDMGIGAIYPKPKTTLANKAHKVYPYLLRDIEVTYPNQAWAIDITYIPMAKGFLYLVAIIDWYSRKVLSWRLSNTMDTSFCIEALEDALQHYGPPDIFNSDQGSQFTSTDFTEKLLDHGVRISMDGKGRWVDNVFIERLWRSLKDVNAQLHSAFIGGQEIHRLVRLDFGGRVFFADVGNGWPALNLFPAYEGVSFECFGMTYRSVVTENWVRIFHQRQGKESLQMEINVTPKSEAEIQEQINSRYTSGIEYPFSTSLRFSLIVGNAFLFLRGNRLERYSMDSFSTLELREKEIPSAINSEFGFDVSSYFL